MRFFTTYSFLLFLTIFISCNNTAQTGGSLTPDEFEKALASKNIQLLDVRTAGEYRSGHLNGSLQADWLNTAEFESRTIHLDKSKPVYVYCQSGARSSEAAKNLREKGFKEVVNLKGGISAWKKSGKKLVGEDASKTQTSQPDYDALTSSSSLVLVDFGAEWCPPCKKMEPVIASFMQEQGSKVKLVKMDGGNEITLMKTLQVEALPTFILYNNGKEAKRKQGIITKEELEGWVN
jgi:thioredoxin